MATLALGVRAVMAVPGIENALGAISVSMQVINAGDLEMTTVQCTGISLGNAERQSPVGFPIVVERIAPGGVGHFTARFKNTGIAPGSKLLLVFRGTYQARGVTSALTLNRYVQIPATGAPAVATLRARIESATTTNFWNYKLLNDEPAGSTQHIASLSLAIAAPVDVTGTPPGWAFDTDNSSYVLWYAADLSLPYPSQVAPGAALSGFQLMSPRTRSEASPSSLAAWDHSTDNAGLVVADYALVPYRFA